MLALGTTNAGGRFELVADFDGEGYPGRTVIVKAAGAGLSGRTFLSETVKEGSGEDERLTFKLRPTATIEGRLLTPAGAPAVGVKVLLEDFRDSDNELEGDGVSCRGRARRLRTPVRFLAKFMDDRQEWPIPDRGDRARDDVRPDPFPPSRLRR